MRVTGHLSKTDLKALVVRHLQSIMPDVALTEDNIIIETRSTQNFKAEWEVADFRATISYDEDLAKLKSQGKAGKL